MSRRTTLAGAFGASLALVLLLGTQWGFRLWSELEGDVWHQAVDVAHGWLALFAWRALANGMHAVMGSVGGFVVLGGVLGVAGLVARVVAWQRIRGGRRDPLQALRQRPRLARALAWAPVVLFLSVLGRWAALDVADQLDGRWSVAVGLVLSSFLPLGVLALGLGKVGEAGMGTLLEPIDDAARASTPAREGGDIVFSAVAVTRRTRAAIGLVGLASVAMACWGAAAPTPALYEVASLASLAAYIAAAAGVAFAFRRASRIAVGLDGVYVGEASHVRFFAYRELDEARPAGADLELVRGGRAVLRLQMHGDDAGRRDEVLSRIREAIAASRQDTARGADLMVRAMSASKVAAAAAGAGSYRQPSLSREQLWEVVEGPTTDTETRAAAAEALAKQLDAPERTRLRVVASQCAEPRLRVAIAALAGEEHADEESANRPLAAAAGRTEPRA